MAKAVATAHMNEIGILQEFVLDLLFNECDFGLDLDDHEILRGREDVAGIGRK